MSVILNTIAQLAEKIEKPERQVRGWVENSFIRHYRIGSKIFVPEGAYEEMLATVEIEPKIAGKKKLQITPEQFS